MNDIRKIKRQAEDLSDTVMQIRSLFNQKTLPLHANEIQNLVVNLRDKVTDHFNDERSEFFPELLNHGDKAIKDITNQYTLEMNSISDHLKSYMNKWGNTSTIKENPAGCINDTQTVCGEITKSITLEKKKLYPYFDKNILKKRGRAL